MFIFGPRKDSNGSKDSRMDSDSLHLDQVPAQMVPSIPMIPNRAHVRFPISPKLILGSNTNRIAPSLVWVQDQDP